MALQFKRGTTATLAAYVPLVGEPLWATNTNALYIGDGSTYGGILISGGGGGGYTLPTASTSTLGGVKIDGTSITIDGNGVISAAAAGNPFDQTLDTTSTVEFKNITVTGSSTFSTSTFNAPVDINSDLTVDNLNVNTYAYFKDGAGIKFGTGNGPTEKLLVDFYTATSRLNIWNGYISGGAASGGNGITIGVYAGGGANSIALGNQALMAKDGTDNIGIGYRAGKGLATGSQNNTIIGHIINEDDGSSNVALSNAVVIGAGTTTRIKMTSTATYLNTLRESTSTQVVYYNTATNELTYGSSSPSNPFNQTLDTTSSVTFAGLTLNSEKILLGSGVVNSGSGAAIGIGQNAVAYDDAIAIGGGAEASAVGSISIGKNAVNPSSFSVQNAIVIATGGTDVNPTGSGFFVAPIQNSTATNVLYYNTSSKELTWGAPIAINPFASATQIAIGSGAGASGQGSNAIAIGYNAGGSSQGNDSIAIGNGAGGNSQYGGAVAIGYNAGQVNQGNSAVAIGNDAQAGGTYSIAIGVNANATNNQSIVLNAQGSELTSSASGFYVDPVRSSTSTTVVYYDTSTKEITYGAPIAANPFDQSLNTTDSPTFAELTVGKSNTISSSLLGQTGTFVVDSIPVGDIRGVKYVIAMDNGTNMHLVEILAGTNGSNTYKTEYGVVTSDGELATFSTDINSGNFRLLASVVSGDLDLTFVRTKIVEL